MFFLLPLLAPIFTAVTTTSKINQIISQSNEILKENLDDRLTYLRFIEQINNNSYNYFQNKMSGFDDEIKQEEKSLLISKINSIDNVLSNISKINGIGNVLSNISNTLSLTVSYLDNISLKSIYDHLLAKRSFYSKKLSLYNS